jgi:hypothetical protein
MNPFGENRTVCAQHMADHPHDIQHFDMVVSQNKVLMLCILIQGPKQAGIDIDVFLKPLMEDMAKLWNERECMWDRYQQEYFTLKAIIFICIHDLPGGFTISGQTKGKSRCPVYVDRTASVYLPSFRKLVFM